MGQFDVDEPFDWFTAGRDLVDEIDDVRIRFRNRQRCGVQSAARMPETAPNAIAVSPANDDSIDTDALLWRILDVKK